MPGPINPDDPIDSPPEARGKQAGPMPGPGGSQSDDERQRIEREVFERRTFRDREAEAQLGERPAPPLGSAGGDFKADVLRGDEAGAAGAAGAGATLGDDKTRPIGASTPEGVAGLNEQQGARLAHGKSQGGDDTAPDQTRGQGRAGSINETDGS